MQYKKTELGRTAFHNRSFALTPRQRSVFIMFDGSRSVEEVIRLTACLGATTEDVNFLVSSGLLASLAEPTALTAKSVVLHATPTASATMPGHTSAAEDLPTRTDQAHYSRAYPIATRLTAALGLRGFRLNLAVEVAGNLCKLQELAPKIKAAVGAEKFLELERALYQ